MLKLVSKSLRWNRILAYPQSITPKILMNYKGKDSHFFSFIINFLNKFYWLSYCSCLIFFSPLFPSTLYPLPLLPYPLVHVHGSYIFSLAPPFPILFSTSPCLFCTYQLCFLFPVPSPPSHSLLITLHVISISVILFLF